MSLNRTVSNDFGILEQTSTNFQAAPVQSVEKPETKKGEESIEGEKSPSLDEADRKSYIVAEQNGNGIAVVSFQDYEE